MEQFAYLLDGSLNFALGYLIASLVYSRHARKQQRVLEQTRAEKGIAVRTAIFDKTKSPGKIYVYDKHTGEFICEFTTWLNLAETLYKHDKNVRWCVQHNEKYTPNE